MATPFVAQIDARTGVRVDRVPQDAIAGPGGRFDPDPVAAVEGDELPSLAAVPPIVLLAAPPYRSIAGAGVPERSVPVTVVPM